MGIALPADLLFPSQPAADIKPLPGVVADLNDPLNDGLDLWWACNEMTGDVLCDLAYPEDQGIITGARWENDRLAVSPTGQVESTRAIGSAGHTYSYRIDFEVDSAPAADPQHVFTSALTSGDDSFAWSHASTFFRQAAAIRTSSGWKSAKLTSTLFANTRYVVWATYDGANLRAYLDSVLEATTAANTGYWTSYNPKISLHDSHGIRLYDLRVYSRAVPLDEIQEIDAQPYAARLLDRRKELFIIPSAPVAQVVSPVGIASAESVGTPIIQPGPVIVVPDSISSQEAFGSPLLQPGMVSVTPDAIPSAEVVGAPQIQPGSVTLSPAAITTAEALGTPVLQHGGVVIAPTGISSEEAVGTPQIQVGAVSINPTGIASVEFVSQPSVLSGGSIIAPTGIPSEEAVGVLTLTPGSVSIQPAGIDSAEQVPEPVLSGSIIVLPSSIESAEQVGNATLIQGAAVISLTGIEGSEAFGTLTLIGGTNVIGWLAANMDISPAMQGDLRVSPAMLATAEIKPLKGH